MAKTSTRISFGPNALKLKTRVTISATYLQPFSILLDLKLNEVTTRPYATYEPNFWLLNGEYRFMPAPPVHVGYMTTEMSSGSTDFFLLPGMAFDFPSLSSTQGLTITFSPYTNDWADSIQVRYYHPSTGLIRSDNYTPTGPVFQTNQAVSNFTRIEMAFMSTNKPYRYLRVQGIDFDRLITFEADQIKKANLVEQVDILSVSQPFNTLTFSLHSEETGFDIINPSADYAALQDKTPLDVYEIVNNEPIYIGRFYLEEWESISETDAIFTARDAIGILEDTTFFGGLYIIHPDFGANNKSSTVIFNEIAAASGVVFDIDPSLLGIQMYGWIPYGNCRDALRLLCFAIGGYASCARSGAIEIRPFELAADLSSYDFTFEKADKGLGSSLSLKDRITGVEVVSHDYTIQTDPNYVVKTIYDDAITVGNHTFVFGEPLYGLTIITPDTTVTATYTFSDNHFTAHVTSPGHLKVIAYEFVHITKEHRVYMSGLPSDAKKKVIRIENSTASGSLAGIANAAQRIYNYHQQRFFHKLRLFAPLASVGDSALIDTQSNRQMGAIIEKLDIDLAGGFTVRAEASGVILPES